MNLCVKGIDFASLYDFSSGLWNCSNGVECFFLLNNIKASMAKQFKDRLM